MIVGINTQYIITNRNIMFQFLIGPVSLKSIVRHTNSNIRFHTGTITGFIGVLDNETTNHQIQFFLILIIFKTITKIIGAIS